jgi:hypothetical protein
MIKDVEGRFFVCRLTGEIFTIGIMENLDNEMIVLKDTEGSVRFLYGADEFCVLESLYQPITELSFLDIISERIANRAETATIC